jgi:hypothetical protein
MFSGAILKIRRKLILFLLLNQINKVSSFVDMIRNQVLLPFCVITVTFRALDGDNINISTANWTLSSINGIWI